jgi:uncharacterized protein (DUF58 family)
MRVRVIPSNTAIYALAVGCAAVLVALFAGVPASYAMWVASACAVGLVAAGVGDYRVTLRAWKHGPVTMTRRLPAALAIGVRRDVQLTLESPDSHPWRLELYDHADPSLTTAGLPVSVDLLERNRFETSYTVTPTVRGQVVFSDADARVKSRFGLCELIERLGVTEPRRVYPDFAQVVRYAWLADDRRLAEIGIKTWQRRGEGTDFKQLSEYTTGDPVRHIDWKATQRHGKPIIREFQDERDQCVMLLIDCGRRMRADDRDGGIGSAHFDQVLNAVMLLTYVALKQGDAVGAMTFGTPAGTERLFAPRKGVAALNSLMGELYAVQPTLTPSDYIAAARTLLTRNRKRALVIVITNFRDEDSSELGHALRLLRSRHLVLLASLRERVVRELAAQPLTSADAALDVASAHLYEQVRRDAFNRLAAHDALVVDAEPDRLGIALVNRYRAVKRAGLI